MTLTPQPGCGGHLWRPGGGGPPDFGDPDGLCRSMQGAGVLYNTYRVRYVRGRITFDLAVENTRTLFEAAKRAGVARMVHFSVTNASSESGLTYFRGKAQVEDMLTGLGIPYAIIRLALVFGVGDLLLNNMARALRRFPVFPVYGNGDYTVQPVYVEDFAAQAVEAGSRGENIIAFATGPDTFAFEAMLHLLTSSLGVRRRFLHTPPSVGLALTGLASQDAPARAHRVRNRPRVSAPECQEPLCGILGAGVQSDARCTAQAKEPAGGRANVAAVTPASDV